MSSSVNSRSSGTTCAVRECSYSSQKLKRWGQLDCYEHPPQKKATCPCPPLYKFYPLPKQEDEKRQWLKNLNLKKPPKWLYVCSFHFVDKRPTDEHPHPTLYLGYALPPEKKRRVLVRVTDAATVTEPAATTPDASSSNVRDDCPMEEEAPMGVDEPSTSTRDASTQWSDPATEDHTYSNGNCPPISAAPATPKPPLADRLLRNDEDALLYTGIPLLEFHTLVTCLQGFAPPSHSLPVVDQILLTLMKLRQNFVQADLCRRFERSESLVSKTIGLWIDIMAEHMKSLIPWLPRDIIKATLPNSFKKRYPNTTCVIDCAETTLQKPKNMDTRSQAFSKYKANNTVKYLLATSPSGVIMFISEVYGGKSTDKFMTQDSGFLDHLRCGDEVMADRGFTIRDLLEERRVTLVMPAFTRKGARLTNENTTKTRRVANVRIHIERAIRRLKVYRILSQTVPITLAPKLDQILQICAGLVNLRGPLIRSKET